MDTNEIFNALLGVAPGHESGPSLPHNSLHLTLVIRRPRLRHRPEPHPRIGGQVRPQLTTLPLVIPGIVAIIRRIPLTVLDRTKRQHRYRRLLAITVGQPEVLHHRLVGTVRTGVDPSTRPLLRRRPRIKNRLTLCTRNQHHASS